MSDVLQTRRPLCPGSGTVLGGSCGLFVVLALACGPDSLDERAPSAPTTSTGSDSDTLPPLEQLDSTTAADEESTAQPDADDPRLCPEDCRMTLPVDWVYQGAPSPPPDDGESEPPPPGDPLPGGGQGVDPTAHLVPVMLRDPDDGSLLLAEQRDGAFTLHHLDRFGRLQWNVSPSLPCDVCELTDVAWHPSGDLLLSAHGLLVDRGFGLVAARYDPTADAVVWSHDQLLTSDLSILGRSGGIAALPGNTVAQLYLETYQDFSPFQIIGVISYDDDGTVLEDTQLAQDLAMQVRHPMHARVTVDGELMVGIPVGDDNSPRGLVDLIAPPLWGSSNFLVLAAPLDDLHADERGHSIELSHTFDGTHTHLVLADRTGLAQTPHWIATQAFASSTGSRASLAVGPQGELYAAVRTTQALGEDAEPLVGLSLARFTTDGELRWHTTVLDRLDDSDNPVQLAVDAAEGLVVATVIDDRLRVERRTQHCECG